MSDQLRDAARRVVEAWDREFGTAEDAKAFEATIEALRDALSETGEADHSPDAGNVGGEADPYPPLCQCGGQAVVEARVNHTFREGKWEAVCGQCADIHRENTDEVNAHEMSQFDGAYGLCSYEERPLGTDADGNRLEGPGK